MNKILLTLALLSATTVSIAGYAPSNGTLSVFDSWHQFANDDGETNPGRGGQDFDAEYLFYKYDEITQDLSIGLQTGFDVKDGRVRYDSKNYYAGDLALSFDGNVATTGTGREIGNTYEYAVDFGKYTEDYWGNTVQSASSGGSNGIDAMGLYQIDTSSRTGNLRWDDDIYYNSSNPFAMDEGTFNQTISTTTGSGTVDGQLSYFRTATFNIAEFMGDSETFTVDAHWTMSCGNDVINGNFQVAQSTSTQVPEPGIIGLFGAGILGMGIVNRRKNNRGV